MERVEYLPKKRKHQTKTDKFCHSDVSKVYKLLLNRRIGKEYDLNWVGSCIEILVTTYDAARKKFLRAAPIRLLHFLVVSFATLGYCSCFCKHCYGNFEIENYP